jgi:hypothetical protein
MRNMTLLLLAATLSACATQGVRYPESPAGSKPVPPHAARVTVYRANDSLLYVARSARPKLDGNDAGALPAGRFKVFEVSPGNHALVADMWDAPGRWELSFEARAGTTCYFKVAPRMASFAAGTPGMALMNDTPEGAIKGSALMLAGMAAESAGKEHGGAFSIVAVEQPVALPDLMDLWESR